MTELLDIARGQLRADVRGLPRWAAKRGSRGRIVDGCTSVDDVRDQARRRVPPVIFDFVDGGASDEVTLRRNRAELSRLEIRPRMLTGVGSVDPSTTVLGRPIALPVIGAPMGLTALLHHRGELALAAALQQAGSISVASCMASYPIAEVARAAPGSTWFQLYLWRDRGFMRELVQAAADAGCGAIVLTVDVPCLGVRERDVRNRFGIPPRLTLRSFGHALRTPWWSAQFATRAPLRLGNRPSEAGDGDDVPTLAAYVNGQFNPAATWDDLAWVRELWDGPLVVKGILRGDDAVRAVGLGADAVVVSNHGGRQLDGACATVTALPEVVEALAGDAEVYLDGGIRRGTDVVKALALGARACLVGRPLAYGLCVAGQAGVTGVVEILRTELERAMTLAGAQTVEELDASLVTRPAAVPPSRSVA